MSKSFPTPAERRKAGPLVEVMHYQAIQLPPKVKRFKVHTPRPRYFDTMEKAHACFLRYAERTGYLVAIEEVLQ